MKYYDSNRQISYTILALSSLVIALWIAIIVLQVQNTQWINIQLNPFFASAINNCGFTYPFSSSLNLTPYGFILVPTTQNFSYTEILVGYHSIYQTISIIFLIFAGASETLLLIITIFLLLKSRQPYRQACYLGSVRSLKISINIVAFFGIMSTIVYWGYTLNFYKNMLNTNCTALILYAATYFISVIIGGVMTAFCGVLYFLSIGIRQPSVFLEDKPKKGEQQTKETLLTQEANAQAQKLISQRLANLPKINQYKPGEMIEMKQPSQLLMYQSEDYRRALQYQRNSNFLFNQNNYNGNQMEIKSQFNMLSPNNIPPPNGFSPTKVSASKKQVNYYVNPAIGRVPRLDPVYLQEIEVNIQDRLNQINKQRQKKMIQEKLQNGKKSNQIQERILDGLDFQTEDFKFKNSIKNYPQSGSKPRLKLFKNRDPTPVSNLKRQWGYT